MFCTKPNILLFFNIPEGSREGSVAEIFPAALPRQRQTNSGGQGIEPGRAVPVRPMPPLDKHAVALGPEFRAAFPASSALPPFWAGRLPQWCPEMALCHAVSLPGESRMFVTNASPIASHRGRWWKPRARRTNEPPPFNHVTPLPARGYERERDLPVLMAQGPRMTGATRI